MANVMLRVKGFARRVTEKTIFPLLRWMPPVRRLIANATPRSVVWYVLRPLPWLFAWNFGYRAIRRNDVADFGRWLRVAVRSTPDNDQAWYFQRILFRFSDHPNARELFAVAVEHIENLVGRGYPSVEKLLLINRTCSLANALLNSGARNAESLRRLARLHNSWLAGPRSGIVFHETLSHSDAWRRIDLAPPEEAMINLPLRASETGIIDQGGKSVTAPGVSGIFIGGGIVFGSGLVIAEQPKPAIVRFEPEVDIGDPFVAGHRHFILGVGLDGRVITRTPPRPVVYVERGVLLAGRAAGNYFHWMIEYLPRLLLLEASEEMSGRDLLVRLPLHTQQLDALTTLASPDRQIVGWRDDEALEVADLAVLSGPTIVHDSPLTPSEAIMVTNPRLIGRMAAHILDTLKLTDVEPSRLIYLSRMGARNVSNLQDVEQLLARVGFEPIRPELLSFAEQVRLFREARVIVGASGAAFTNLIFCRPGTKALILNSERHVRNSVFSQLAQIAGSTVVQVPGRESFEADAIVGVPTVEDEIHADYKVPARLLQTAIEWALGSRSS